LRGGPIQQVVIVFLFSVPDFISIGGIIIFVLPILLFFILRETLFLLLLLQQNEVLGFFDLGLEELGVLFDSLDYELFSEHRPEFAPGVHEGLHNHINVPLLVFEWVTFCSVVEGCDRVVQLSLEVSLLEVLLHLGSHPLEVEDAALGGVGMVGSVHGHVQDELLVFHGVLRELLRRASAFEGH
jgi:hypothetical protein